MSRCAALTLFILALALLPASAAGDPPPQIAADMVEVSLMVDGRKVADTWVNIYDQGTRLEFPGPPILMALSSMVHRDVLRDLEARFVQSGMLSKTALKKSGILAEYDADRMQLTLKPIRRPAPRPSSPDKGPWTSAPVPALAGSRIGIDTARISVDSAWAQIMSETGDSVETIVLDQTREDLYEQIFKKKAPPRPSRLEVTLKLDGKPSGEIRVHFNPEHTRFAFPAEPVLVLLKGIVKEAEWERLAARPDAEGRLTPEIMGSCGFPTALNETQFELEISIPAQNLGTQVHSLIQREADTYDYFALKPNAFSAYLNVRLNDRLTYFQNTYDPNDTSGIGRVLAESNNRNLRQPLTTDLDGAVNALGWVVEGRGVFWESFGGRTAFLQRQDIRVVKDIQSESIRFTAGDLLFPTTGYQTFVRMGGIGISRDFSLQPNRIAYPTREFEFFLANRAEVKVYINSRLVGTLQLEPGTHNLQDFPFSQGESEVEIRITDNTGARENLTFSFIHEPSLLGKGVSMFGYNMGLPSRDAGMGVPRVEGSNPVELLEYEYDAGHPMAVLDYRRGITERLTLGLYSQITDSLGVAGVQGLRALPMGKALVDLASSLDRERGWGFAGGLAYTYIPRATARLSPISWRAKGEFISSKFTRPILDEDQAGTFTLSGSMLRPSKSFTLNSGASYSHRLSRSNYYNLSLGLSKSWIRGLTTALALKNTYDRTKLTTTLVSATLMYSLYDKFNSGTLSQRAENHRDIGAESGTPQRWDNFSDIKWDYNSSAPFPINPVVGASAAFGPVTNEYNGSAGYRGNQGVAWISARRVEPAFSGAALTHQNYVDLDIRTGLAYVDGNLALSRPIDNSFLMVKGVKGNRNCDIKVDPNLAGYDAYSRPWLPAVQPSLQPYFVKKVRLEAIDPPIGAAEEKTDFTLYPTYKSAYVLYLGSEATVIAYGTLMLGPGRPVGYQALKAVSLDDAKREPVTGFTNDEGKFQLPRLKPGRYRIDLQVEGAEKSVVFRIAEDASGIIPLGEIRVP